MRLLVVGKLNGQLASAVKMAMTAGAKVSHVETAEAATHALRAGQGADLLLVDYDLDIAGLISANEAERIRVPVVACGVDADAQRTRRRAQTAAPAAARNAARPSGSSTGPMSFRSTPESRLFTVAASSMAIISFLIMHSPLVLFDFLIIPYSSRLVNIIYNFFV